MRRAGGGDLCLELLDELMEVTNVLNPAKTQQGLAGRQVWSVRADHANHNRIAKLLVDRNHGAAVPAAVYILTTKVVPPVRPVGVPRV